MRIVATIRLLTTGEGGYERPPETPGYVGVLRVGDAFVFSRVLTGELLPGVECATTWELIAPLNDLTDAQAVDILRGRDPGPIVAAPFAEFVPGQRVLVCDGFAVVGKGVINERNAV